MALSATGRNPADFTLTPDDLRHPTVKARLHAKKGLQLHSIDDRKELPDRVAAKAHELTGKVVVFLSSVDHAEKCAQALRKLKQKNVATLTGTMRGAERDGLVRDPVFSRFLPRPPKESAPREGTVFLVATSAGEVGIDISADHLVSDLPTFDALAQRLGRVNRYGEGDAAVHVFCEKLKEPPKPKEGEEAGDEDESSGRRKDEYEHARFFTRALLEELPRRADERLDASPAALRGLALEARQRASTPEPDIHHVDELLFDRWSYTTFQQQLPGRPPVAEWLHGVAEWEPPRTTVAWRREVAWLTEEMLGRDSLDDLLADYPLRSRETLSDLTPRVLKHLKLIAERDEDSAQNVWLVPQDGAARILSLRELVDRYDPKKNPVLDGATIILAPVAGGLRAGLLDGSAVFDEGVSYDLGPAEGDRAVHEFEEETSAPSGMRLVRTIERRTEDDEPRWWHLYASSQRADDEGSRTARFELLLDTHLLRTEAWANRIAERLGLPDELRLALARAGGAHDLGKKRRVWQRSIKRYEGPALAKGPMQPSELGHYRHELGSLHDGDFAGLSELAKDLALHVVAAHHGRARPHFPLAESFDPEVADATIMPLVRSVPLRFDRLQRRYGRWGLAWLESILRAADVLGSEDQEVAG